MKIDHFYHVWAAGAWSPAAREHDEALHDAGFPMRPKVGVTGPQRDRDAFRGWAAVHGWEIVAETETGFEQVTLSALRSALSNLKEPTAILYAHTKGARTDLGGTNSTWRREMTSRLVGEWRICLQLLESHDAVGCCWRNQSEFPQMMTGAMGTQVSGIFAGNFWWATASFLAGLPEPDESGRDGAEQWLGLGKPDAVDLLPFWPISMNIGGPFGPTSVSSVVPKNTGLRPSVVHDDLGE